MKEQAQQLKMYAIVLIARCDEGQEEQGLAVDLLRKLRNVTSEDVWWWRLHDAIEAARDRGPTAFELSKVGWWMLDALTENYGTPWDDVVGDMILEGLTGIIYWFDNTDGNGFWEVLIEMERAQAAEDTETIIFRNVRDHIDALGFTYEDAEWEVLCRDFREPGKRLVEVFEDPEERLDRLVDELTLVTDDNEVQA